MKEVQLKRDLAKADVYRLLSACFYQPEEAFLEENIFTQLKNAMALVCPL
jgi:TorA maturation chaperone TorD